MAYESSPTNPFVIDILARTLSGKVSQGLKVDGAELEELMPELKGAGDAPGISFYDIRQAEIWLAKKSFPGALRSVDAAIQKTPGLVAAHCLRAQINIAANALSQAEKDVQEINRLLEQAGGYSPEDEAQLVELQVRILIEKRDFQAAKDKAMRSNVLPHPVSKRLLKNVARAIGFEPNYASKALQAWSKGMK